jgi:DNA polymerase III delta subunit
MKKAKVFCVIGEDFSASQAALTAIKNNLLQGANQALNFSVLYSHELTVKKAKDILFSYSFEGDKIVLFREAQNLSKEVKALFTEQWEDILKQNYLIFDIASDHEEFMRSKKNAADPFYKLLFKTSQLQKLRSFGDNFNIFKLIGAIRKHNLNSALYILENLFLEFKNETKVGMQILGMLIKEFSRPQTVRGRRQKYLKLIWDADRMMKVQGADHKLALSVLITRLISV